MLVVGLAGTAGSGKSAATRFFERHGFSSFRCSDIIRQECTRLGLTQTREHLFYVSTLLVQQYGHDIVARRIADHIFASGKLFWIIDGIRRVAEVEYFRRVFPCFFLLAIDAPSRLRYERIVQRGDTTDTTSYSTFLHNEHKELTNEQGNMQLAQVLTMADATIDNDSSLQKFEEKLQAFLSSVQS
ncbi:MAG: AAA family ATPase [Candidatus Woesearchaeota archaeon]